MIEVAKHAKAIKAADRDVNLADNEIATDDTLLEKTETELAHNKSEMARLTKIAQQHFIEQIRNGKETSDDRSKLLSRIRNLCDLIEGAELAIPKIKVRIAAAMRNRDQAVAAKPAVILPIIRQRGFVK